MGIQKHRMNAETSADSPTCIWSVAYLPNDTIVSGNSLGDTEFWDSTVGVQLQSLRTHAQDITCLAASRAGNVVIVGGINSRLVKLHRTNNGCWVLESGVRHHTHDVFVVAMAPQGTDWIVSGGLDTLLIRQRVSSFGMLERYDTPTQRLDPFPHFPVFSTYSRHDEHFLLSHAHTSIDLWHLGHSQGKDDPTSTPVGNFKELPLAEGMRHLLHLDLKTSLPLMCSAVGPQGRYIAASDTQQLFVFSVTFTSERVVIKRLALPPMNTQGILRVVLTANQLILADTQRQIRVMDLRTKQITSFDSHVSDARGAIHALRVSDDGQWLASSDTNNNIHVFNLDVMKHYAVLPRFAYPVTAIAFSPVEPVLTVACSNSTLYQYNVEAGDLTNWSKKYSGALPEFFLKQKGVINNISFDPANPSVLFLVYHAILIKVDLSLPVTQVTFHDTSSVKKRKRDGSGMRDSSKPLEERNFNLIAQYSPMIFASFVAGGELVIVQRPRAHMLKDLPAPAFAPKTF